VRQAPGIQICQYYPRIAKGLGWFVFEVNNLADHPVDWVAWNHRFHYQQTTQSPLDGHFSIRSSPALVRCIHMGRLEPRQQVMCVIENNINNAGFGISVIGEGDVSGSLAGTGRRRPRTDAVAQRYTGPEWLAPGRKFIRSRLDELLERLRAAAPAETGEDMRTLLYASRRVNDDLPVVNKPEIVAAFAELLLRIERRPRGGDVEDEEPEPRVMRGSDPFEFCLLTLLELVPPEQLRPHGEALGALSVHACRDRRVVELLIKAGSATALKELAAAPERLPRAGREGLLLAARAASGDEKAYTALLERFAAAKGEVEKVELGRLLAVMGREQGLKAVAGQLRDTRDFGREGAARQEVRSALTDALRLAYPEERVLYVGLRPGRTEMVAVERFCAERFGVKIAGETPDCEADKRYETFGDMLKEARPAKTPGAGEESHEHE
jgi:hypothetical protein